MMNKYLTDKKARLKAQIINYIIYAVLMVAAIISACIFVGLNQGGGMAFIVFGMIWCVFCGISLIFTIYSIVKVKERNKGDIVYTVFGVTSVPLGFGILALVYVCLGLL